MARAEAPERGEVGSARPLLCHRHDMQRRGFLTNVALGATAVGAGAIWLPGCGGAMPRSTELGGAQADALLERLQRGVARVRNAPFGAMTTPPWSLRGNPEERMARLGLEALVVADVARSIPAGSRLPESLARGLDDALPVLDQCVVGYHALLESTPAAVRRNLDRRFRETPEIAMHVAEAIDVRAREIDVSTESRIRLRNVARNVGARVRRQSTSALIDDCASKIATIVGHGGADVRLARSLETRALVGAIWQQVEGVQRSGGGAPSPAGYGTSPASSLGLYQPAAPDAEVERLPTESPGDPELAVGGVMGGAGLAVFGIGGIISAVTGSTFPLIAVATPAGVAVVIGIILLIVGGVQNA